MSIASEEISVREQTHGATYQQLIVLLQPELSGATASKGKHIVYHNIFW